MGHTAARKQLTAARFAAPIAEGWISTQEGNLQHFREPFFELRHHKAADEAAARAQQLADAAEQGRPFQQFFGERAVGGVVGVEQVQPPAGVGGGNAWHQLEHRIHHQLRQQLAGHVDRPHARIPQADQRKQLALFVVVGAGHQRHQGTVHR